VISPLDRVRSLQASHNRVGLSILAGPTPFLVNPMRHWRRRSSVGVPVGDWRAWCLLQLLEEVVAVGVESALATAMETKTGPVAEEGDWYTSGRRRK